MHISPEQAHYYLDLADIFQWCYAALIPLSIFAIALEAILRKQIKGVSAEFILFYILEIVFFAVYLGIEHFQGYYYLTWSLPDYIYSYCTLCPLLIVGSQFLFLPRTREQTCPYWSLGIGSFLVLLYTIYCILFYCDTLRDIKDKFWCYPANVAASVALYFTITKWIPQVHRRRVRKRTEGVSMYYVIIGFLGYLLLLAYSVFMFLYNYHKYESYYLTTEKILIMHSYELYKGFMGFWGVLFTLILMMQGCLYQCCAQYENVLYDNVEELVGPILQPLEKGEDRSSEGPQLVTPGYP